MLRCGDSLSAGSECLKLRGSGTNLQMDNAFQRGQWMNDSESDSCLECKSSFNLLLRRHHCRRCGGLFCDICTSKRILIPDELFVVPPNSLFHESDASVLNRCCSLCATRIANLTCSQTSIAAIPSNVLSSNLCGSTNGSQPVSNLSTPVGTNQTDSTAASAVNAAAHSHEASAVRAAIREIDCLEWKGGTVGTGKSKTYSITVPSKISIDRRFQASLDNRVMTIILPLDIVPGQRIRVKAPSPSVSVQRAQAVSVQIPTKKVRSLLLTANALPLQP